MGEIQELKSMITNLSECMQHLTTMTRNLFHSQLNMKSSLLPRLSEQEQQTELLSSKFNQFLLNAPSKEDIDDIKKMIKSNQLAIDTSRSAQHTDQDPTASHPHSDPHSPELGKTNRVY